MIPSNQPHSVTQQKPYSKLSAFSILVSDDYLRKVVSDYTQLTISFYPSHIKTKIQQKKLDKVKRLFNQLVLTHYSGTEKNVFLKQTILVNEILYLIVTYFSTKLPTFEVSNDFNRQTLYINEFIQKNFRSQNLIHKLAIDMNLTPSHLSRLYKKESGRTLSEQINDTRLYEAYNLVSEKKYTVDYISDICGFSTTSYFIKKFKNKFDITPKKMDLMLKKI